MTKADISGHTRVCWWYCV